MEASGPLEDAKEKQNVDSLTTSSSPMEHETLTSNTEVDHALESATKTETMEDKSDKMKRWWTVGNLNLNLNLQTIRIQQWKSTPLAELIIPLVVTVVTVLAVCRNRQVQRTLNHLYLNRYQIQKVMKMKRKITRVIMIPRVVHPISKPSKKSQNDDLITKRPSDMELDYGMVDPLELARQVAIEVELEVDSQEQSCSVSTSTNEKEHQSTGGPGTEVSSGPVPPRNL
ncbi:hypothetical protein HanRHA438_Chr06g0284201 [Helianthus annuus]|nr:hypothetical protein HanRHA438_Chr06g0284201 [Helianthus annuus]